MKAKTKAISLSFEVAEFEKMEAVAKELGFASVTALTRYLLKSTVRKETSVDRVDSRMASMMGLIQETIENQE